MPRTAAVILAAGSSSRFGRPKQFLQFGGRTLLQNAIDAATGAGCEPVFVVIATEPNRSANLIADLARNSDATIIENPDCQRGIGTSIRAGVQSAATLPDVAAVILMVCDQPFLNSKIVDSLLEVQREGGQPIVASTYADTLGVPALFHRHYFPALLQLLDNEGAKVVITQHRDRVAEVPFPKGSVDIDTEADWEALQKDGANSS